MSALFSGSAEALGAKGVPTGGGGWIIRRAQTNGALGKSNVHITTTAPRGAYVKSDNLCKECASTS